MVIIKLDSLNKYIKIINLMTMRNKNTLVSGLAISISININIYLNLLKFQLKFLAFTSPTFAHNHCQPHY